MLFGGGLVLEAFPWGSLQPHERQTTLVVQLYVLGHFGHLTSSVVGSPRSSSGLRLGALRSPGEDLAPLPWPLEGLLFPCPLLPGGGLVQMDWASREIEFCMAVIDCMSWSCTPWFQPLPPPFRFTVCHSIRNPGSDVTPDRCLLGEVVRAQLRNADEMVVPKQPLGEEL